MDTATNQSIVQDITNLSSTISEFGVTIVIAAVFIVTTIIIVTVLIIQYKKQSNQISESSEEQMKQILENNKTFMDEIIKQNRQLTDVIISLKETEDHKPNKTPTRVVSYDKKVEELLSFGRTSIQADRADIYLFTNGTQSYNHKRSFLKYIKVYSSTSTGVEIEALREGPISLFPSFFERLMEEEEIYAVNTREFLSDDPMVPGWLEGGGGAIAIGLVQDRDEPIGFISCAYERPQDLSIYEKKFHDLTVRVSVLLDEIE